MNQSNKESRFKLLIPLTIVLAGLSLIPLLPIGMTFGVSHVVFTYAFLLHLGLHALAVATALCHLRVVANGASPRFLLSLGIIILFIVMILVECVPPITARDALVHHLAVPKWWVEDGLIHQITWHEWSYYPMLLQLAYTALIQLEFEAFAPVYHFSYLLLCCSLIASFVEVKTKDYDLALIGYLICLSLPVCIRLGSTPMVDLGLALFMGVAFCSAIYWAEGGQRLIYIVLCGAALGLALSTKYNGLLAVFLFLLLFIGLSARRKIAFGQTLGALILIGTIAGITYSPWPAKNAYWTLNPFYPLYKHVFGNTPDVPNVVPSPKPLQARMLRYGESALEIAMLPFRMILFGEDHNPRKFDGRLSPILILLLLPPLSA